MIKCKWMHLATCLSCRYLSSKHPPPPPPPPNYWLHKYIYKWKNHFYEMKGDVGTSLHEIKGRNKEMPTPRHKVTHNPIPTSLFCFNMLFVCLFALGSKRTTSRHPIVCEICGLGRNKDVGIWLLCVLV